MPEGMRLKELHPGVTPRIPTNLRISMNYCELLGTHYNSCEFLAIPGHLLALPRHPFLAGRRLARPRAASRLESRRRLLRSPRSVGAPSSGLATYTGAPGVATNPGESPRTTRERIDSLRISRITKEFLKKYNESQFLCIPLNS